MAGNEVLVATNYFPDVRCQRLQLEVLTLVPGRFCRRLYSTHPVLVFFAADSLSQMQWSIVDTEARASVQPFLFKVVSDRCSSLPAHASSKVINALITCSEQGDASATKAFFDFLLALIGSPRLSRTGLIALRAALEEWGAGHASGRSRVLSSRATELKESIR